MNRSFSVVGVFVKRLGAPPPSVTTTTRRPFAGAARALFLPLPAMLEGTRGENQPARGCVCQERGVKNKGKFGANRNRRRSRRNRLEVIGSGQFVVTDNAYSTMFSQCSHYIKTAHPLRVVFFFGQSPI